MTTLHLDLGKNGYDITVGAGILLRAGELFNLKRRVAVLTDTGVPREYAQRIADCAQEAIIITVEQGEGAKSVEVYADVVRQLIEFGMTRSDCMVAVGGGVVGDLCGFVAASYMRGIDYYSVPTTVLSQIDSSIGGKTALNHAGIKNVIGAFHQPRGVLIDLDTQKTLPKRQIANGLAEAVKMAVTFDSELFRELESIESAEYASERIVVGSLTIKKRIVEQDEREAGIRKALNFGHTLGHAIEAREEMRGLYHGECVAIGMLYLASDEVRERLIPVLERLGLPTSYGEAAQALEFVTHDKKCEGDTVSAILCERVGEFKIVKMTVDEFSERILSYEKYVR